MSRCYVVLGGFLCGFVDVRGLAVVMVVSGGSVFFLKVDILVLTVVL